MLIWSQTFIAVALEFVGMVKKTIVCDLIATDHVEQQLRELDAFVFDPDEVALALFEEYCTSMTSREFEFRVMRDELTDGVIRLTPRPVEEELRVRDDVLFSFSLTALFWENYDPGRDNSYDPEWADHVIVKVNDEKFEVGVDIEPPGVRQERLSGDE